MLANDGVTTRKSSPNPAISPSIASVVFFSLFIALFNSTRSLSFSGLMLTKAIVYPSLSESSTGFTSSKSSSMNGLTRTFDLDISPSFSNSTYSDCCSNSSYFGPENFSFIFEKKPIVVTPQHLFLLLRCSVFIFLASLESENLIFKFSLLCNGYYCWLYLKFLIGLKYILNLCKLSNFSRDSFKFFICYIVFMAFNWKTFWSGIGMTFGGAALVLGAHFFHNNKKSIDDFFNSTPEPYVLRTDESKNEYELKFNSGPDIPFPYSVKFEDRRAYVVFQQLLVDYTNKHRLELQERGLDRLNTYHLLQICAHLDNETDAPFDIGVLTLDECLKGKKSSFVIDLGHVPEPQVPSAEDRWNEGQRRLQERRDAYERSKREYEQRYRQWEAEETKGYRR